MYLWNDVYMAKKILLNISGHPLSSNAQSQARDIGFKVIDIPVPNVDVSSSHSIEEYINTVYNTIAKNKNIVSAIKTNSYSVIPPGLSILTSGITAMLHGISGSFPTQLWLIRETDGIFQLGESTSLDLQNIRLKYRDFRNP